MAHPKPQTRHFIARRLRAMVRLAIVLVVMLLVVFAGGALFLASSSGKALVLRTLSASLRQSTRGRGTRRPSRLPARLARRHAARRQHQATRRGARVPQRGARGGRLLPRHFPRNPRPPPARCHQARSRARLHNASVRVPRLAGRGRLTHAPPQPFPHSTSRAGGCAISRSRRSVQTARTSLFAGSRCRSPAKGQESCEERSSLRVGGPSGAARRRSASIGHGRTCHWPERRWRSRRSRWSRRWRRSAGPRTSTSAAAISM